MITPNTEGFISILRFPSAVELDQYGLESRKRCNVSKEVALISPYILIIIFNTYIAHINML